MPFTSNAELEAAVADWLDRDDLLTQIPDFIFLGEVILAQKMGLEGDVAIATGTVTAGSNSVPIPADLFEPRTLTLFTPSAVTVELVAPAEFNRNRGDGTGGLPAVARVRGNQIIMAPVTSGDATYELEYIRGVQHVKNGGTELLAVSPNGLLFAALCVASAFLEGDERVTLWATGLDDAVTGARRQMSRLRHGPGTLRQRFSGATP